MTGRPMILVPPERVRELMDAPNITIALGEALKRAGIASIEELTNLGAERAWERLCAAGALRTPTSCSRWKGRSRESIGEIYRGGVTASCCTG